MGLLVTTILSLVISPKLLCVEDDIDNIWYGTLVMMWPFLIVVLIAYGFGKLFNIISQKIRRETK
jgi:hypothetical protein